MTGFFLNNRNNGLKGIEIKTNRLNLIKVNQCSGFFLLIFMDLYIKYEVAEPKISQIQLKAEEP